MSDLHLEVRAGVPDAPTWTTVLPLGLGPRLDELDGEVDLVILAGDIASLSPSGSGFTSLDYAGQVAAALHCRVIFVPGNHEYWGLTFHTARERLLVREVPGVTVLDRRETVVTVGQTRLRVLGATLWTDYAIGGDPVFGMLAAVGHSPDHRRIWLRERPDGTLGGFQPQHARRENLTSRAWLIERLEAGHDGPTLIVSHHVPHAVAHSSRRPLSMSGGFVSNCTDVLMRGKAAGVVGWIFGHSHYSVSTSANDVPLLSAQWGYPNETTGWTGPMIIDIDSVAGHSASG